MQPVVFGPKQGRIRNNIYPFFADGFCVCLALCPLLLVSFFIPRELKQKKVHKLKNVRYTSYLITIMLKI